MIGVTHDFHSVTIKSSPMLLHICVLDRTSSALTFGTTVCLKQLSNFKVWPINMSFLYPITHPFLDENNLIYLFILIIFPLRKTTCHECFRQTPSQGRKVKIGPHPATHIFLHSTGCQVFFNNAAGSLGTKRYMAYNLRNQIPN